MHLLAHVLRPRTQARAYLCREHAFRRESDGQTNAQLRRAVLQSLLPLEPVDKRRTRVLLARLAMPDGTRGILAGDVGMLHWNVGFVRGHE